MQQTQHQFTSVHFHMHPLRYITEQIHPHQNILVQTISYLWRYQSGSKRVERLRLINSTQMERSARIPFIRVLPVIELVRVRPTRRPADLDTLSWSRLRRTRRPSMKQYAPWCAPAGEEKPETSDQKAKTKNRERETRKHLGKLHTGNEKHRKT